MGDDGERPRSSPRTLEHGTRIARYLLLDMLGSGASGLVYAAYDPELDRRVALKLMECPAAEHGKRDRLLHEAKAMARIDHPNVVSVHDAGIHEDWVWVAMALVEGPTLDAWLRPGRTRREILDVMTGAGRGLDAAHRVGVVHRDFKPANVLVSSDGVAKVGDFGLANIEEPTTAKEGRSVRAVGTPAYMSPEHLGAGVVDARSDQFSFCVALAEAILGERPFVADSMAELARKIVHGEMSPKVARGGGRLGRLLRRGLSSNPDDRFASMEELLVELEKLRRRLWPMWAAAIAGTAAVVGSVAMAIGPTPTCVSGQARVKEFWTGARADAAKIRAGENTSVYVEEMRERYVKAVDAYASAWATAYDASCERVGPRGDGGTTEERREAQCLDNRIGTLQGLTEFVSQRGVDAASVTALLEALPSLEDCSSGRWTPYPSDPEAALKAAELHHRTERIMWARLDQADEDLLAEAQQLARDARALGDPFVLSASLRELGRLEADVGQVDSATKHLDEALQLALANGHDRGAATIISDMLIVAAQHDRTVPALERLAVVGLALAERVGSDIDAGHISLNRANVLRELEQYEGALAATAAAEESYRRAGREDLVWRLRLTEVAILVETGEVERAVSLASTHHAELVEALGDDAPEIVYAEHYLAYALIASTRYEEGLEVSRMALERARRVHVPGARSVHRAAWTHAVAAVKAGRFAEAEASLAFATHPTFNDPGTDAAFRAAVTLALGRPDEAARTLDAALALGETVPPRGRILLTLERARVHLVKNDVEAARALLRSDLLRSFASRWDDSAIDFAFVGLIAGVSDPGGTTWSEFLAEHEPQQPSLRAQYDAAMAMANRPRPDELVRVRNELARHHGASIDVKLFDGWIARHAGG